VVEGALDESSLDEGWPAELERGVAGSAIAGESRSGDLAVFAGYAGGALVAVLDGLGHGDAAADASAIAAEVIRRHRAAPAADLLQRCHDALKRTRGVVMTMAWFDLEDLEFSWAGVGNVEARLVRGAAAYGDRHDSALVLGGVVGYNLPTVRPSTFDLHTGDAVAFATDGIEADYSNSLAPGVPAQLLADRIYQRHHKGTDDALAVVVRYVGGG
jgi:negative regulator of sigma-B (phosphoserine phosphatase)